MTDSQSSRALGDLADPAEYCESIDLAGFSPAELIEDLRLLTLIRKAEEKIGDEFGRGVIKCPCHLVIGQEAPALGIARSIEQGDRVFGAHRSHAHYLALGGDLRALFAEVLGRDTGCSRGMGGSMHLQDRSIGLYGTVPIVCATVPIATGAALAARMDGSRRVAISFLGDGATEEGVFHESLNLAAVMKLPVVFVIENNLFSSHLHISLRQPFDSTCRFAEASGIPWRRVDGNDIAAMRRASAEAIAACRAGRGPYFIEAVTYRWRGHVGHREDIDVGVQRQEGLIAWKHRDPIRRLSDALVAGGHLSAPTAAEFAEASAKLVADAWATAWADPFPPPESLLGRVYFNRGAKP